MTNRRPVAGRDDSALHRRRRARALHALPDKAKVVSKPNLPLDRALVEIVGVQRRIGRIDDRRIEPETLGHVSPFLDDFRLAAARAGANLARLQQPDDRRHVEADHIDAAVRRVARGAAPVRSALVARHVNHFIESDRRERTVIPRLENALA